MDIWNNLKRCFEHGIRRLEVGPRVGIKTLGDAKGMFIMKEHPDVSTIGVKGTVIGYVPGGDIWWIKHDDGNIGAYVFDEFIKE